jgi:hypothetical protein
MTKENYIKGKLEGLRTVYYLAVKLLKSSSIKII